jgi:hypothetical protein
MNGRPSSVSGAPVPTVAASCSATIGGEAATINYCGEAPYLTAGDSGTSAFTCTTVTITIGGVTSQAGVTLAVK